MFQVLDYSKLEGTQKFLLRDWLLWLTGWRSGNQRWFNFLFSLYFFLFILSIQNVVAPAQGKQAETMITVCSWNFLACAVYFWLKHFLGSADKPRLLFPFQMSHRTCGQSLKHFIVTFLMGKCLCGKDSYALSAVIMNTNSFPELSW